MGETVSVVKNPAAETPGCNNYKIALLLYHDQRTEMTKRNKEVVQDKASTTVNGKNIM
jgi:hypothetical protein